MWLAPFALFITIVLMIQLIAFQEYCEDKWEARKKRLNNKRKKHE